jgi:hypothetical protein
MHLSLVPVTLQGKAEFLRLAGMLIDSELNGRVWH